MGFKSQILPLAVGAIKTREEFSTIQVNCFPGESTSSDTSRSIDVDEVKVLFPMESSDTAGVIPLSGGAIVKLALPSSASINTLPGNSEAPENANLSGTYDKEINKLKTYIKNKVPGVGSEEFASVSDLIGARNRINKCLISMPSILDQYHGAGVPTLLMSSYVSGDGAIATHDDLQAQLDPGLENNQRYSGLRLMGNFKFIPINVIKKIFEVIVNKDSEESGLKNYVGLSGETFESLLNKIVLDPETGTLDEAKAGSGVTADTLIPKLLMEICPIFRLDEDVIIGGRVVNDIGFYTALGNTIYVKMPDLSGRDSSGFSDNIYNITQEDNPADEETITLAFELLNGLEYSAKAVNYLPPPCPEMVDNDLVKNSSGEGFEDEQITLTKDGLKQGVTYRYFLSPIFESKNKIKAKPFDEVSDGIELFTAPLLTKCFMDPADEGKAGIVDVSNAAIKEGVEDVFDKWIDYMQDQIKDPLFGTSSNNGVFSSDVVNGLTFSSGAELGMIIPGFAAGGIPIKNLGFPGQVKLSKVGIKKQAALYGEINRPEILIGYRDGDEASAANDMLFHQPNTTAASEVLASVTPNIMVDVDGQIPAIWSEVDGVGQNDEDPTVWQFSTEKLSDLFKKGGRELYNNTRSVEFAVYVVDELGQFARIPGTNLTLYPSRSLFSDQSPIKPSGFNDHNEVIDISTTIDTKLTLTGGMDVVSVNIYSDELGLDLVTSFQDGSELDGQSVYFMNQSTQSLTIRSTATWDAVSRNVGTFYMGLEASNGDVSPLKPFYIASPGTTGPELPPPPDAEVIIKKPFNFKVPKFGKGLHSLPVLMDGTSSNLIIKTRNKGIFQENNVLYAYIALVDDGAGKAESILKDFCFVGTDEVRSAGSVKINDSGDTANLLVPMALEYEFGQSDFSSITKRKASLKFPGSVGAGKNLSRLTEVVSAAGEASACIIITNFKWSGEDQALAEGQNYGVIPMGGQTRTVSRGEQVVSQPFSKPPHVLGLVAALPSSSGDARAATTIGGDDLDSIKKYLRPGLKRKLAKDDSSAEQRIIAGDALDHLAVVFSGAKEPRLSKRYKVYIGTKKLKKYRAGKLKYIGGNKILANFKNITEIKDEGWTDITIQKNDKRFKTSYDSTLWTRTTVYFDSEDVKDDGDGTPFLSTEDSVVLNCKGGDKQITQMVNEDGSTTGGIDMSTSIFDINPSPFFSYMPTISTSSSYIPGTDATDTKSYLSFGSPVKIMPSTKLVLGAKVPGDTAEVTRAVNLSDALVDPDTGFLKEEIIDVSTTGMVEPRFSPAELISQGTNAINELNDVAAAMNNAVEGGMELSAEAQAALDAWNAGGPQEEFENASNSLTEAMSGEEASAEALEIALSSGGGGDSDSGGGGWLADAAQAVDDFVADLNAAADAAEAAVAAVNDLANSLLALVDELSSIVQNMLDAASDALDALSSRPSDFTKVNLKYIYLKDQADLVPGTYRANSDDTEWQLTLTTKITQNAAIKFNVPEIVAVKKEGADDWYTRTGGSNGLRFGKLEITTDDRLTLKTIGTTLDTKFEVAGKRVESRYNSSSSGIFLDFDITIPNLSMIPAFGSSPCTKIAISNTNENRMRLGRTVGANEAVNIDDNWAKQLFGGNRSKSGAGSDIKEKIEKFFLKFTSVRLDKANVAKEFIQSFCDFSFHLTAELSLQLRNFKVLLIPIKIIFCIIDVICALLHPIRLAFAIIRLFLCLYDLILLLPPLSVPAMCLALLLHILELLLCVITKILSIITAINEISSAMSTAIDQKNYPSIVALEEAINEHLFSLEADLEVLEPILTILALFLELLQLLFAFPCKVGHDADEENCIDASMLAGLIVGKVAPFGRIEPDALLPLAQSYTRLPVSVTKSTGNSPPDKRDNKDDMDCKSSSDICNKLLAEGDFIVRAKDSGGARVSEPGTPGADLPGLRDNTTGELKTVQDGGFFAGDTTGAGTMERIDYPGLRFIADDSGDSDNYVNGDYIGGTGNRFDATFGLSFTRSTKAFSIFTGPDPRIVRFEFNEKAESSDIAWWWKILIFPLFFRKKLVDEIQTLDSPPMFLTEDSGNLIVDDTGASKDFISPIDGATGFLEAKGGGYQPKPLTVTIDLNQPGINETTLDAEFEPVTVTKTFGNIPMIALVDDSFNVYFVEPDGAEGGIKMNGNSIESINVKMINHPSAPKKKFGREDKQVYRDFIAISEKGRHSRISSDGITSGEKIIQAQANALYILGQLDGKQVEKTDGTTVSPADVPVYVTNGKTQTYGIGAEWTPYSGDDWAGSGTVVNVTGEADTDDGKDWKGAYYSDKFTDLPHPELGFAYDFSHGNKKEGNDIGEAIDNVKVFDFPRFYIVDMRQVADDIAAACGASMPAEMLMDLPGFDEDRDYGAEVITPVEDCLKAFLDYFKNEEPHPETGVPLGVIPMVRHHLENGEVWSKVPIVDDLIEPDGHFSSSIKGEYDTLVECINDAIDNSCEYTLNPLNTSFYLNDDEDDTDLPNFVNPEQADLKELAQITENWDTDLDGLPMVTGAMEYASGIGDLLTLESTKKAFVTLIPRDSYDDEMSEALDLTDKIKISFVVDETETGATLVPVNDGEEDLIVKDGTTYTAAIYTETPGKVVIRAEVCGVVIQAVTERGIQDSELQLDPSAVDCIDDAVSVDEDGQEIFAPGALMKVDRLLTILFTKTSGAGDKYGDDDRDLSAKSAKPGPQTFGTKLEN